jgi:hypothetical protein
MSGFAARWDRFWFEPEKTATLALIRICFGALVFFWTLSLLADRNAFFSAGGVLARQPASGEPGRDLVWGLLGISTSTAAVTTVVVILLIAALCLMMGLFSRLAALIVFIGVLSLERRNPFVLNSGDGLIRITAFFLMLAPSGVALSLDRLRKTRDRFWEFPRRSPWAIRLLQIQFSVLYLSTAWAKLRGVTWNDGTAVSYALRIEDISRFGPPGWLTRSELTVNLMTYGTLCLELGLGILVWNRVLRPWVLALGVAMHLAIDLTLRVGFFSYAVLVLYIAFLPPDAVAARVLQLRDRLARVMSRRFFPFVSRERRLGSSAS